MTSVDRPSSLPDLPPSNNHLSNRLTWAALPKPRHAAVPADTNRVGDPGSRVVPPVQISPGRQLVTLDESPIALHRELDVLPAPSRLDVPAVQPAFPLPAERKVARARRTIPPLIGDDPMEPEIYRQIFTGLTLPKKANVVVIGVTSAIRGEGRSTIALGLAATLAIDLEVPVTLVEADLEHPSLAEVLHADPSAGLSAVLREEYDLFEVVCNLPARFGPLSLIPAGKAGKNVTPLLRRLTAHDPFRGPKGLTGLVILDLPPVVNTSFGALAAGLADATILVVRAGVTPHQLVREAITRLVEHPPQGVVLNAFRSAIPKWWPGRQW